MPAFAAFVHKAPPAGYGVSFPDVPGCISVADTWTDVPSVARQVLAFHLEGLRLEGVPQPRPRDTEAILSDPELSAEREDLAAIVLVDLEAA